MDVIFAARTQILLVHIAQTLNVGLAFCLEDF